MTQTLKDKISEPENKHFQAGWQAALDFMKNREEKINNSVSGKEDVKLPEVGKKYRANYENFDNMLEAEIEYISKNKEVVISKLVNVRTKITVDENKIHSMDKFIKYFEELPEDNIEEKLTGSVAGGGKSKIPQFIIGDGKKEKAQVWIDELVEKPKSIWKDVSELQEKDYFQCLVRLKDGEVAFAHYCFYDDVDEGEFLELVLQNDMNEGQAIDMDSIKSYCTLTDYINNTEERLKKLEGK